MKQRRLGRFTLPFELVQDRAPDVTRIMGTCAIYRAEGLLHCNRVEYFASSRFFDEVDEGYRIPLYEWRFAEDGSIEAVKLEAA